MDLVLRVKIRTHSEWAVLFVIFMPFTFGLLIDFLGLPSLVKYSVDLVWLFLLVLMARNQFRLPSDSAKRLWVLVLSFFASTLIGAFLALKSPLYYLWGFRNNFRFFVFFFSCIMFVNRKNVDGYLDAVDALFYLNFLVALFQHFFLGYKGDRLGGIFGVHIGCNDTTVVFLSIVIAKSVLFFMNGKESVWLCGTKCVMALSVAVFAEIKVFFVLLLLIISMCTLLTGFSIKKFFLFSFSIFAVFVSIRLVEALFTNWTNWFSLENMLASALSSNGYTNSGDMNRLTSAAMTWNLFLTTWEKRLFGLGLGNCDTSSFSIFSTAFFQRYSYLHYNWFSLPFMFVETGLIGLACYLMFFVRIYLQSGKQMKKDPQRAVYCQLAQVMAVVSMVLIVYNQSMRTEAGYMMYFMLSLPFNKERK